MYVYIIQSKYIIIIIIIIVIIIIVIITIVIIIIYIYIHIIQMQLTLVAISLVLLKRWWLALRWGMDVFVTMEDFLDVCGLCLFIYLFIYLMLNDYDYLS